MRTRTTNSKITMTDLGTRSRTMTLVMRDKRIKRQTAMKLNISRSILITTQMMKM